MTLPSHGSARARLPVTGRSASTGLPTGTRTRLPHQMLYTPPPIAYFAGGGTLSATAAPCATAEFNGIGLLAGAGVAVAGAGFAGDGALVVPTNEATAAFAGDAALTVSAIPCATAQFTGMGTLGVSTAGSATASFAGSGSLAASGVPSGTASFTGGGSLTATASVFSPSGMTKSGSAQSLTGSYAQITAWTADTASYPGSTLSGNGLLPTGGKTGATITANLVLTGGFSWTVTARLLVNGSVVATGTGTSSTPVTVSTSRDVVSTDVVTVEAIYSGISPPSVATGTGTYVRIT